MMLKRLQRWWAIHSVLAEMRVYFALIRGECFVVEICQKYQVGVGTIYPILIRAEGAGLVDAQWQEASKGRRMAYRLTEAGMHCVEEQKRTPPFDGHWNKLEALFPLEAEATSQRLSDVLGSDRVAFNINSYVYVRLTDLGLQLLRDQAAEFRRAVPQFTTPYREPVPDERGYYQFQMWMLMEAFGPVMGLGRPNYFDMDVEFRADDLTPVLLDSTPPTPAGSQ